MDVVKITPMYTSVSSRLHFSDESSNFMVLVDGQEVNLEYLGLMPWSLQAIALDDVERIEVVQGPMSALYGGGALAGVIHIITRMMPEDSSAWAGASGGEVNSLMAGARASARFGDWGISVWGGGSRMSEFDDSLVEGTRSWGLRSAVEYRFSYDTRLRLDGTMSENSGRFYSKLGPFDGTLEQRTLRLSFQSETICGQLHWSQAPVTARLDSEMGFAGITLATFAPVSFDVHTLTGDVQYYSPPMWSQMLFIVGGQVRVQWLDCDRCLDRETYADEQSERHHRPGVESTEIRGGVYTQAEWLPLREFAGTANLRLDYDSGAGLLLSTRLAAVVRPDREHYMRLAVGHSWRRSAFLEEDAHIMAEFPPDSPIIIGAQEEFQEFMSRIFGGGDPRADTLLSVDASYLGRFFREKLTLRFGLFYNNLSVRDFRTEMHIYVNAQGLLDMNRTSAMFSTDSETVEVFGTEVGVRFKPSPNYLLQAWWVHRVAPQEYRGDLATASSPADMLAFGGRARTGVGLLGSCYFFYRSTFRLKYLPNPYGFLAPSLISDEKMHTALLLIGKLGWELSSGRDARIEVGIKVFLPISFSSPHFRYREGAGWEFPTLGSFGAQEMGRMVIGYLQGSF